MKPTPVIAVFDIGKTNKKLFLFDEHYKIVFEESSHFAETIDEDGFPCDDIVKLSSWVKDSFSALLSNKVFDIRAVSYSAYGASFVYLDEQGKVTGHLYNYLKEYPADLHRQFYDNYGGETAFANRTASPVLGNLNSGLQLYRLKYQKPDFFNSINTALHLPQFISYLVTGKRFTDMTSIGSHTGLWDFINNDYHEWVSREKILQKLAPIVPSEHSFAIHFRDKELISGIGLHDSSAALIPYLVNFNDPFVLISSGTWNISLNPFNQLPLTIEELQQDCLCYISYEGKPVKASRLFAGHKFEIQMKVIAEHYNKSAEFFKQIVFDPSYVSGISEHDFSDELNNYQSIEEAYHHYMYYLVKKQFAATSLVLTDDIKNIFVDGGFSSNSVFMNLLASCFPSQKVYAATIAQSTALGSAMILHNKWNSIKIPADCIELKYFYSVNF